MTDENNNWVQRNITDNYRVDDTVKTYKALGFEVKVEDFNPETCHLECNVCMIDNPSAFKIIYTRKGDSSDDEDLFDD